MPAARSLLDHALLGLLAHGPASGYDLRKVFQDTLLGRYSDSPGSIYPALARLERGGLVQGTRATGGRKRRLLTLSPRGRAALLAWLDAPEPQIAMSNRGAFELKLAFYSDHRTPAQLRRFLLAHAAALAAFADQADLALRTHAGDLSPSGVITLEMSIHLMREKAGWCRHVAHRHHKDPS